MDGWSRTLGVIVRHEQALETIEMSDWFCGLSVHASMIIEAGVINCCRLATGPAVIVTVVVPVGIVVASTVSPVVTVVVVVTVLSY